MNVSVSGASQPLIAKHVATERNGIRSVSLSRNAIGYVVRGRTHIYYGDSCYEVVQGELFYLSRGIHDMEQIPDQQGRFEQIVFYYSSDMLGNIVETLGRVYGMNLIGKPVAGGKSYPALHAKTMAWSAVKHFFNYTSLFLKDGHFPGYTVIEKLIMTELICIILSRRDCSLASRIMADVSSDSESFEKVVESFVFEKITLEEMANRCGMSLSSLKNSFRDSFHESPHIWIRRRRIMHSRTLLLSTNRTISDIASECRFKNPSHFIKIFRKEFGYTPAEYKARMRQEAEVKI